MKTLKYLFISLFLVSSLTSCFEDPGTSVVFTENLVELDAATTPARNRTFTYLRLNDGATRPAGFFVNRASASGADALTVNFTIDANSTAIAGIHYNVTGSSVTIPAGQFRAELPFTIIPDGINAGQVLTINVTLTDVSGGNAQISPVFANGSHRIQISCPPNIPTTGTWSGVTTRGAFGNTGTNNNVTITQVGTTINYDVSDVSAGFFVAFGGGAVLGRISNVCDAITLATSPTPFGSIETSAANNAPAGTWNPTTQVLTVPWYNAFNNFAETSVFTRN